MNWDKIRAKCPLLYRKQISFQCGLGWAYIIHDLSVKIEKVLEENPKYFEIFAVQIKEKYGTLRFHLSHEPIEIRDLIDETEAISSQTCENCGLPGKMRGGAWIEVRCDKCYGGKA